MYRITKAKICNIQPQLKKSLKRGDKTYIKDNTMAIEQKVTVTLVANAKQPYNSSSL